MSRPPALLALTASALAVLGQGRAVAQPASADDSRLDYRYSAYREAALPAEDIGGGDGNRYSIDTHQFRLAQGLGVDDQLVATLTHETMSGASPWYVQPVSGRAVQVMSGASIQDRRSDVLLGLNHRSGRTTTTYTAGYSREDDYRATNLGIQGEWSLQDTVTTLSAGLGHSDDRLNPTVGATEVSTTQASRSATRAFAGWSRVLDAVTVVQASLSYTLHEGFLSDPYKRAWVDSLAASVVDRRPDRRSQVSWTTRLRRFLKGPGAAVHADYRYYRDNWDVHAHTLDLAWHQPLGDRLRVVPGLRYYSQTQASFYQLYYAAPRADGLASSDYRLSPYGALSLNLSATVEVGGWGLSLRYEDYDSDAGYALGEAGDEHPGLVDFRVVSVGLKTSF